MKARGTSSWVVPALTESMEMEMELAYEIVY
jgi:hypothetical protein